MSKIEANRKAIGKYVVVLARNGFWKGLVTDVRGEDFFLVKDKNGKERTVSMFDIRYDDETYVLST